MRRARVEGGAGVGEFHAHALAGDDLHTVTSEDVVFDFIDAGFERLFAELADGFGVFAAERERDGAALAQLGADVFEAFAGAFVAVGLRGISVNDEMDFCRSNCR